MRLLAVVSCVAGLAVAAGVPALAAGTTRIQQADGVVNTYPNAGMRLAGHTLWVTSGDRRGVLEIATGACTYAGELRRCYPSTVTLHQHHEDHVIALDHGTIYFNLSDAVHHLPHSSEGVPPHGVLVAFETARGTFVTMRGTLDAVAQ